MSFEDFVQSMGFSPDKLDETQAANLKRIHSEQYPEDEPAADASDDTPAAKAADAPVEEEEDEEEEMPTNAGAAPVKIKGKAKTPAEIEAEADAAVTRGELKATKRINAIRALAAEYGNPHIEVVKDGAKVKVNAAEHAIAERWDEQKAELHMLRAFRSGGPAVHNGGHDKSHTKQALQAAMILRAGGKLDHKAYKTMGAQALLGKLAPWLLRDINDAERNRYMEAGHRFNQMSMVDLCRESLRLDQKDIPSDRDDMIRAAFSGGGNLTNIFTTNVNAILLSTYVEYGDDTTAGWCSEQDVNDFKTNERPRVNVADGLKKLPRGSEAEHTSYTDSVESYKIARYARQFEIDEQDAIDDNFSVFADVPVSMGQAAARLRPDLVYGAVILANPTLTATALALFSDSNTHDNLRGSSTFAFSTLSANLAVMRLVRENSVNLNFQATHLIVPPSLEDLAVELTMSTNILYGADDETVRGSSNSLQRRGLQVLAEPRLENGVTNPADETAQTGSASSWYLVCADAHTVEVGYLKGTGRAPRVRTSVLDKGRWGMNWDVSMDIGVKALDYKGMQKSTT